MSSSTALFTYQILIVQYATCFAGENGFVYDRIQVHRTKFKFAAQLITMMPSNNNSCCYRVYTRLALSIQAFNCYSPAVIHYQKSALPASYTTAVQRFNQITLAPVEHRSPVAVTDYWPLARTTRPNSPINKAAAGSGRLRHIGLLFRNSSHRLLAQIHQPHHGSEPTSNISIQRVSRRRRSSVLLLSPASTADVSNNESLSSLFIITSILPG